MNFIRYVFRKYPVGLIIGWCIPVCSGFIIYDWKTKGWIEWVIPASIFGFTVAVLISFLIVEYVQGRKHKPWNL
jgi:hypothetical protein